MILIIWIALLGLVIAGLITFYEYHGFGDQNEIVRSGNVESAVSLTFDDGPNPKYTPDILDILKNKGVKATFFVVGSHVKRYPDIARRIVEDGHDIANHTYNHRELVRSSKETIVKELDKTNLAIADITGVSTNLFRPPRGLHSKTSRQLIEEKGYKIILWSLSSVDWQNPPPSRIINRVKKYVKGSSIILFHDSGSLLGKEGGSRQSTVKALPAIIDYLHQSGYTIEPVSKVIA
ncbi:MAG: polysaccharide deacetylase family protein [Actinobacteria bacterium]|nr:MAG: polysaccharide deacetylase family protein [Actinomycetota bacterium]